MKNVIVICSHPDYDSNDVSFPPVGTFGTVVSEMDEFNEFDVEFYGHPCPVGETSWVTHVNMVVFIDLEHYLNEKRKQLTKGRGVGRK